MSITLILSDNEIMLLLSLFRIRASLTGSVTLKLSHLVKRLGFILRPFDAAKIAIF
jgi:hypothetical protein